MNDIHLLRDCFCLCCQFFSSYLFLYLLLLLLLHPSQISRHKTLNYFPLPQGTVSVHQFCAGDSVQCVPRLKCLPGQRNSASSVSPQTSVRPFSPLAFRYSKQVGVNYVQISKKQELIMLKYAVSHTHAWTSEDSAAILSCWACTLPFFFFFQKSSPIREQANTSN